MKRVALLLLGATVGTAGQALAQVPTRTKPPLRAPTANAAAALDLVADYGPPTVITHAYTASNPCTPHDHTITAYVRVKQAVGAPLPAAAATLLTSDGQPVASWDNLPALPTANGYVNLGKFSWIVHHDCSSGTTSVSPAPPPNYRFVVDPNNQQAEASESNNTVSFYVKPGAAFTKLP